MTELDQPQGVGRDRRLIDSLRGDLTAASFTVPAIESLLGPLASAALGREQSLAALRATDRPGDLPTLVRLFVLGTKVARDELDHALPRLGTSGAERLGLVTSAGLGASDPVRADVDLRPYQVLDAAGEVTWWLASDQGELAAGEALQADHVLGVGASSVTLAQVTIREPRERALDLGTGCAIQALHASRHCSSVVATDTSRRALSFAAFNAALAHVDLDLRAGSMLAPVRGQTFDLVVSNPPFVITPGAVHDAGLPRFEYRQTEAAGDDVVSDLVLRVGTVLAPGGVAQLLGNWEFWRGEGWQDRIGSWVDACGLDAWVIQREVLDPAEYAETWLRDGGLTPDRDPARFHAAYAAWLDDFERRGVEGIGFGIITLRRPMREEAPLVRRLEEHTGSLHQPLGAHLAHSLAMHDWLAAHDDAALAAAHLTVAADVTEERYLEPGSADPRVIVLRQGDGLGRGIQADTALAGFVGGCDGELSVGQIIGALAALLEVPAEELAGDVLPSARGLVRDGFLLV